MLFKARNKVHFISKIINSLWPRIGWTRLIRYNSLRVKRLPGTPHSISLGFAFGVMAALTPFFGLHFLIGIFFAWIFGASIIASIIGNFIGNPWTFPFICIVNFKIGSIFYTSSENINFTMKSISNEIYLVWNALYKIFIEFKFMESYIYLKELQLIPSMFIGSIFTSTLLAGFCYFTVRFLISNYKKNKIILRKKITKGSKL